MPLQTNSGTYITGKESAKALGITYQGFCNLRSLKGDGWLHGHRDIFPGRVLFRLSEVERLRREREGR